MNVGGGCGKIRWTWGRGGHDKGEMGKITMRDVKGEPGHGGGR